MELSVTLPDGLRLFFDGAAPAGGGPYPTSRLRRGLLLADAARELAEEGVGFGVPVVKRGLETVFPGTVALTTTRHGQAWEAQAVFGLDLVERLAARGGPALQSRPLYAAKDALAALHRRAPALRGALTATSSALRRGLRWRTVYVPGEPAGTVTVRFRVQPQAGAVTVTADLSGLRREGLSQVVFMNELGARLFDRYRDADGAELQGDEIGAWHEVSGGAGRLLRLRPRRVLQRAARGRGTTVPRPRARGRAPGLERLRLRAAARHRVASLRDPRGQAGVTSVLLVYPFFRRRLDRSRFRFPPLGIAYVAAALREAGHHVRLLDCTFLRREEARARAVSSGAQVVGIYAMASMEDDCLALAAALRGRGALLVAGGPLPTCEPQRFVQYFDAVVCGEGEATMVELLATQARGADLAAVPGVVCGAAAHNGSAHGNGARGGDGARPAAPPRPFARDLDELPFPARDLLPNDAYIAACRRSYGFAITTVMSTRGCPFSCEFCSNVVFGQSYRARSAQNVVDEVEQALALGYDRISFADDVFTLDRRRVLRICDEIERRGLRLRLGVPGPRGHLRRRHGGAHARGRLLPRVLRHRVGQRSGAGAHGQAHHRGAGPPGRAHGP